MLCNFDPAHVAVDQNFTPILFEFGMLVGEGLDTKINEEDLRIGTCGYIDPSVAECVKWSLKSDVYAFGIVLLSLMSKRVVDWKNARNTHVGLWGVREYKRRCSLVHQSLEADPGFELQITKREYKCGCSLVHQSLEADPGFDPRDGPTITKLAMQCIEYKQKKRPEMKEVVKRLKDLRVVQQHGEACGEAFYIN
ncbi:PREDICTED: probable LRR receptor-like serine/threonine-protein kinase At5g59680 [Nicotiana attenuata]|nr:PREDICTED: probable LRR receptor-like serine/threonine-protein kinase At5g59680 [Nicotiana attenuata]